MILPEDTPLGVNVIDFFHLRDDVLDISILPNRGDAQSMLGLARELSVILNKPLKRPVIDIQEIDEDLHIPITVSAPDLCPKYTARVIKDITIKPSPFWMQQRLRVCGIRPINNIVDITNYVLLEYGQPLHAFDLTFLDGPQIQVRTAVHNEHIQTLDGVDRVLTSDALLICDAQKPVALAGVMGGLNSEIKPETKDVLLEAAYFKPTCIRKTEVKTGLRSESSIRFEKGIDFECVEEASNRAAYLIQLFCNGKILKNLNAFCSDMQPKIISFSAEVINQFLGSHFSCESMIKILTQLGFTFSEDQKSVYVPSFRRNDISEMPCLAEEIARHFGLDQIKTELPKASILVHKDSKETILMNQCRNSLTGLGFDEIKTFTMISPNDIAYTHSDQTNLILKNPLTPEESVMRPNLLASGLKVLAFNLKRQAANLKFFEIGKIFIPQENTHREEMHVQALVTGCLNPNEFTQKSTFIDFRYMKGLAERLCHIADISVESIQAQKPYLHPIQAVVLQVNQQVIGEVGILHPKVASQYGIADVVGILNINLTAVAALNVASKKYKAFSKFPAMRRDLALVAPKSLTYQAIEAAIGKNKPKLVKNYFIFDYFESEKIGLDKRSIAMGFIYQSDNETLTDDKINGIHTAFCTRLKDQLLIEMR